MKIKMSKQNIHTYLGLLSTSVGTLVKLVPLLCFKSSMLNLTNIKNQINDNFSFRGK